VKRWARKRLQIVCTACRARLRHSGWLWLRGGSAEGSGHDAVQGRERRGSVSLTLGWERGARSGRSRWASGRARAGAKGRPTNGVGGTGGWAVTTVAGGCWWRGGRGWLVPCALVGTSELEVTSGFEREGERLGSSRHWPVGL
jgi:hypothetical protein